jgi:hypothetical protein
MEAVIKSSQEEMKATVRVIQGKIKATIISIRPELEETAKIYWRTPCHSSTNGHRTSASNSTKIEEMQLGLQAITMSLIVDTKKEVHEEFNFRIPQSWHSSSECHSRNHATWT